MTTEVMQPQSKTVNSHQEECQRGRVPGAPEGVRPCPRLFSAAGFRDNERGIVSFQAPQFM